MLENFRIKSETEYNALSAEEKGEYNALKRMFDADQKKKSDEKLKGELKTELEGAFKTQIEDAVNKAKDEAKAETAELLKAKDEDVDAKLVLMEKAWKSSSITNRVEKAQTMTDYINAKFSTEEGEALLKSFCEGNKKGFFTKIDVEKANFVTPVDGVGVDFRPIVGLSYGRIHARNVVPTFPTISNLITFLRLTASATADGIQITGETLEKGEIIYDKEMVQVPVVKLAGYINFSEESLDDVIGLRAWLASELPQAYLKVEDQYIFKDPTYGIHTLATAWVADGAVNSWDTLISAMAQVETGDNYVTAFFVSPAGKKELLRNKDLINGLYTYPLPAGGTGMALNGVPIYSTSIFTGLEFLAGDFTSSAVTYHVRKDMEIKYSEEHADNFIKNVITVLIEGRGAIAVRKPYAFVKGNLVVSAPVAPTP